MKRIIAIICYEPDHDWEFKVVMLQDPVIIIVSMLQDLIEMLVRLQGTVECQGKKVADLEDYIDTLLIRVMDTAPVLLEKNILFAKK